MNFYNIVAMYEYYPGGFAGPLAREYQLQLVGLFDNESEAQKGLAIHQGVFEEACKQKGYRVVPKWTSVEKLQ